MTQARLIYPSVDSVVTSVLSLVGVHTRALHAMLTVSSVEWSTEISTACVECVDRPRLLLNPDFVAKWCTTPQRLAALIMHELLHIALGHTRLYPQPTIAHNIAFDAIINRTVLETMRCANIDMVEYAALFTEFYSATNAPSFLLRPPSGWPDRPDWDASAGAPESLRAIHHQLYGSTRAGQSHGYQEVTYTDIIDALRKSEVPLDGDLLLLGGHGATATELAALSGTRDTDAAQAYDGALQVLGGQLPGVGGIMDHVAVADTARTPALERTLVTLLMRACSTSPGGTTRFDWYQRPVRVVHRLHDRRAASRVFAYRQFGAPPPLLFDGHLLDRRPSPVNVAVYIDVSGSMDLVLPHLRRALLTVRARITPTLYWFSTEVVAATRGQLERGEFPTTGGTAIGPVIAHALSQRPETRAAVIITDGWLESISRATAKSVRAAGVSLHLGILGSGPTHARAPWVASSTPLPSPRIKQ